MADPSRGLLDTSVLIDLHAIDPRRLPEESVIAAITLAELAAGPHAARNAADFTGLEGVVEVVEV